MLIGTYILSDQQEMAIPTVFFEFSGRSYTLSNRNGTTKGTFSTTGDNIEFVSSDGKVAVHKFSRTPNAITIDGTAFVRATNERLAAIGNARKAEEARQEEARKAEEEKKRRAEEAGKIKFIAQSERPMNWADAKAFCQQQGGRLPRINDSDSWGWNDRDKITHIDGFGVPGAPWPSGLPGDVCWTGTEDTDGPGGSWVVDGRDGEVGVSTGHRSHGRRVVCVP